MENLVLKETETEYIVSFKKDYISEQDVLDTINKIRLKKLMHKINADETAMEELAEEIKQEWWDKNEHWVMDKVKKGEEEFNRGL
ncbi:MAG: hypothetical protein V4722_17255 [Bacteroidota bacterium]